LVIFKAAFSVVLLLLLLPAANYYLTIRREMLAKKRDLLFARISCILLVGGSLVVGLAPTSSLFLVGKNEENKSLYILIQYHICPLGQC
jgi:hypothetical protein